MGEECLEAETWAERLTQSFSAREWRKDKDRQLFRPHSTSSIRLEVRIVEGQGQSNGVFTLGADGEEVNPLLVFEIKFVYNDSDPIASSSSHRGNKRKRVVEPQSPDSDERPTVYPRYDFRRPRTAPSSVESQVELDDEIFATASRKELPQTRRNSVADTESENEDELDGANLKPEGTPQAAYASIGHPIEHLQGEPESLDGLASGLDQQPHSRQPSNVAGPSSTAGAAHDAFHQVVHSTPRNSHPFSSVPTPTPGPSRVVHTPTQTAHETVCTNVSGPPVHKPSMGELEERLRQLKERSKDLDAEFAKKLEDHRRKLEIEVAKHEQEVKEKEQRNKSMEEF
ncbi:hypothetical protein BT96DRAFT_308313 [Gymnopus androsaceus JB14]|uniref:Uncharacterized protein n=1 Tax=Gymnopus androsaceus JB14 TaxID=1447944 RepID=A0A6A4H2S9_9AGAR|nr:hypothetical protein BT96DRAFT_308313 [Gymnopus androsaceus JB14]